MATYWENSCSFGLQYVSWYKYLIVSLVFFHLGFWSGNLFLIAPFPDLCLLVPFNILMLFHEAIVNDGVRSIKFSPIFHGALNTYTRGSITTETFEFKTHSKELKCNVKKRKKK